MNRSSAFTETRKSGLMSGGGLGVTIGKQQQSLDQTGQSTSAAASTVGAIAGNVTINAGKAFSQTGSDILTPAGDVAITAQSVNIQEARETGAQSSEQMFKQSGLTLAITSPVLSAVQTVQTLSQAAGNISSSGIGFTASASVGQGRGAGNSSTYSNTHVEGQQVVMTSGALRQAQDGSGDMVIKGATVTGQQVTANTGGNLIIQSLQDASQYKEKSQSAGGSVMIGAGGGGSLNLAASKIKSDYLSVNEQSAIRAGDGGFNVNVQGKTSLTGGQITSTQAAIDNGKNTFTSQGGTTVQDLQNSASYSAQSVSVGTASSGGKIGLSGVGIGSDKGSASSMTTAGISGVAGNAAAKTGDKETGIGQIFNKDQVKQEVAAQVAITSEFGKQASKAVGEYAETQRKDLSAKADAETDPDKKAQLQAEMAKWEEGGSNRVVMHAAVGGLTGGAAGAVGAGASQAAIDQVGRALKDTNLPTELKQALVLAAGTAVGAVTSGGSVAGAATAFNATANNYLTHAQLQSKNQQLAACKDDACKKQVNSTWEKVSQAANTRVEDAVLQSSVSDNLKTMESLSSDMNGLAQYKTGLEAQLKATSDPTQRASLQLQINETDNSMRQVANLGKNTLAQMYQQTGDAKYQNAFQALTAATSGNELGGALVMPGGSGGNVNKAVQGAKSGAQLAQTTKINALADEAQAANASLSKANSGPADSSYVAPKHTSKDDFQTHGLSTDQVPASITNQLVKDLQATFGAGAEKMAKELINSGRSVPVPVEVASDTKLYKLVPDSSAYGPKADSPYFVDASQFQRLQKNPSLAKDILGLPPSSQAPVFKVYEVQPQPNTTPTVYQSDVATATSKAGSSVVGNATQTLVPDRSLWTEPKLTNIKIGGQ